MSSTPPSRTGTLRRAALATVALVAGGSLFLAGYTLGVRTATTPGTPGSETTLWAPFWDTYAAIRGRYALEPVAPERLVEGALKGMVEALDDPYSAYLPPRDYERTLESLSGRFEGIGAEIGLRSGTSEGTSCATVAGDCRLVIIAPIEGAPADRAGLRAGDIIDRIDGSSATGLTLDAAIGRIRGPKGTTVTLSILRGEGPPIVLRIAREVVVRREVVTRVLGGGVVGYVKVSGFSDAAADAVVAALREGLAAGRRSYILDLRGNPGGFVTAAERIASQFLPSGPVYWTVDATGERVATNAAPDGVATDPSIRLVVLVDGGSASASEIVAGALQDTGRATLVGSRTFGKGTIQGWIPLEDDRGGFKLTVARWLTPNGRWIHGTGLTPDVVVPAGAAGSDGPDPALARALWVLGASG